MEILPRQLLRRSLESPVHGMHFLGDVSEKIRTCVAGCHQQRKCKVASQERLLFYPDHPPITTPSRGGNAPTIIQHERKADRPASSSSNGEMHYWASICLSLHAFVHYLFSSSSSANPMINFHCLGVTADTLSLTCFAICRSSRAPPGSAYDLISLSRMRSLNLRLNSTWTTSHFGLSREDLGS